MWAGAHFCTSREAALSFAGEAQAANKSGHAVRPQCVDPCLALEQDP